MNPSDRKICQYCENYKRPKCALADKCVKRKNSCGKFIKKKETKE